MEPPSAAGDQNQGATTTAFNVVRFKVKPGMEEAFLDAHRDIKRRPHDGAQANR